LEQKDHYLAAELRDAMQKDASVCAFIHDIILDGIWYWDLENQDQEWMSNSFWATLGYDGELMPHSPSAWMDKIHPDDFVKAQELIRQHLENPSNSYFQEIRYFHKDGTLRWIRCIGKAMKPRDGRMTRMLGAHIDITELRNHQLYIERQNKFQEIIISSSSAFISSDEKMLDAAIEQSLLQVSELLLCQRAAVYEYDFLNGFVSCIHECTSDGIHALRDDLQFLSISDFYDFSIIHQEGKPILIENIDAYKLEKPTAFAVPNGIRSIYLVPMMFGSVCQGFIEFNWTKEVQSHILPEQRLLGIYAGIVENAIQRARTERNLRQEQYISSRLIARMNECVMILDLKGRIVEVNEAFMQLTGFSKAELSMAAIPFYFFDANDNQRLVHAFQSTIYNQAQQLELKLKTKAGEFIPVEISVSAISNDKGVTLRYFTTIEDISTKKRAEKEMKEMRSLLVETSNIAKVGGWEIDINDGKHIITSVTSQILEVDIDEEEIGEKVKYIVDDKEETANRLFKRALRRGEDLNAEFEIITAKGNHKWIHIKSKLDFTGGLPSRFVGIIYDITTRVEQMRAIEERNHRLSEIAWTQSHVVRAPLARLMAITDYLKEHSEEPQITERITKEISVAAEELDAVVKDIAQKAEEVIYSKNRLNSETLYYAGQKESTLRTVLIDDDPVVLMLQTNNVITAGLDSEAKSFLSGVEGIQYLKEQVEAGSSDTFLILLDINMPEMDGWSFLDRLNIENFPLDIYVIMVTSSTNAADKRKAQAYPRVISFVEKVLTKEKVSSFMLLPPLAKCYFS
jgi:PAS domain S-box-containing protein